jgi:universal stress protein E
MLFGTTTVHLFRKCPCPVWVMEPSLRLKFNRILAAVGPYSSDDAGNALNAKIIELAYSLAQSESKELNIIHAWDIPYGMYFSRRMPIDKAKEMRREIRSFYILWLEELLKKYALEAPKNRVHLLRGEPERLIPNLVMQRKIDLIVMGTNTRTGVLGVLICNTAEEILTKVDCSVLTGKPDNFITPLKL